MILCAGFLAFYGEYRVCRIHDLSYHEHFSDADNIYHHILFLYAVSRTIQNILFNTPYDVTTSIKYKTCKILRFSLKSSLYTIFWCYTAIRKNNPYSFPGRDFVCLLVNLTFCSHVHFSIAPVWMSISHVSVNLLESVLCFEPFFSCHNRNLLFFFVYD